MAALSQRAPMRTEDQLAQTIEAMPGARNPSSERSRMPRTPLDRVVRGKKSSRRGGLLEISFLALRGVSRPC